MFHQQRTQIANDWLSDDDLGFNALNETEKLKLAQEASDKYREQLINYQNELCVSRSIIEDKESIIENLMLRYDMNIIEKDANINTDNNQTVDNKLLMIKAAALTKQTEIENELFKDRINMPQLKILFGSSVEKLIPYKLNDEMLAKYKSLFTGYYRQIYEYMKNIYKINDIQSSIIQFTSQYFPIFLEPEKEEFIPNKFKKDGTHSWEDLIVTQQLQLTERACEIYKQQIKYMKDHLVSLKSLINDKDVIINRYVLQYKMETKNDIDDSCMDGDELKNNAIELVKKLCLENFEMMEYVIVMFENGTTIFGMDIDELIPNQLNYEPLLRYKALFDGYYRELYVKNNALYVMIPDEVTEIISLYFPIFLAHKA